LKADLDFKSKRLTQQHLTELGPLHRPEQQRLFIAILAFVGTLIAGTAGYVLIEGWNTFDAFYMTVITLATIGYGETHPLSDSGRWFTIVLIFVGIGQIAFVGSAIGRTILDNQVKRVFDRRRKVTEQILKLSGHTIFCGFSRLGKQAAKELAERKTQIVIIDSNEQRIAEAESLGLLVIQGDATMDEVLLASGVTRAARLVTLLPRDSDNLYVILTARELNSNLYIVSRAEDEVGEKRLKRAGASRLISTYGIAARKLADGLIRPFVTDFFEVTGAGTERDWRIEEVKIPSESPICGKTLQELSLRQRVNVSVAAVISPTGSPQFNPAANTIIESGSIIIAMGLRKDISLFETLVEQG